MLRSSYSLEVEEHMRLMEPVHIKQKILSGSLTDEAHRVALKVLREMGADTSELPSTPPTTEVSVEEGQSRAVAFVTRCWDGEERLWKAYWLLGMATGLVLAMTAPFAWPGVASVVFWAFAAGLVSAWGTAVWRCAFRSSHWIFAVLARGVVAVNVVWTIVAFLQSLRAFRLGM